MQSQSYKKVTTLLFVGLSCEPFTYSFSLNSLPRIALLTAGYQGLCELISNLTLFLTIIIKNKVNFVVVVVKYLVNIILFLGM